ncbi:uncharacterized protein [Ptychodera flava]|uniref:uncharacterized protein n=1 Tax=Ptychodera flava TaxID=63121 RepID=UPI00396AAB2C
MADSSEHDIDADQGGEADGAASPGHWQQQTGAQDTGVARNVEGQTFPRSESQRELERNRRNSRKSSSSSNSTLDRMRRGSSRAAVEFTSGDDSIDFRLDDFDSGNRGNNATLPGFKNRGPGEGYRSLRRTQKYEDTHQTRYSFAVEVKGRPLSGASDGDSMDTDDLSSVSETLSTISSVDCINFVDSVSNASTDVTEDDGTSFSSQSDTSSVPSTCTRASTLTAHSLQDVDSGNSSKTNSMVYDRFAPLSDAYIDDELLQQDEQCVPMETDDCVMTSPIFDDHRLSSNSRLPDDADISEISGGYRTNSDDGVVDPYDLAKLKYARVVSLAETGYASDDDVLNTDSSGESIREEPSAIGRDDSAIGLSATENFLEESAEEDRLTSSSDSGWTTPDRINRLAASHAYRPPTTSADDAKQYGDRSGSTAVINNLHGPKLEKHDSTAGDATVTSRGATTDENSVVKYRKRGRSGSRDETDLSLGYKRGTKRHSLVTITTRPKSDYFAEYADLTTGNVQGTPDRLGTGSVDCIGRENSLLGFDNNGVLRRSKFGKRESTCTVRRSSCYSTLSRNSVFQQANDDEYTKVTYRTPTHSRQPDLRVRVEDHLFRVHSVLMKERSGYFRGILSSDWAESFHIRQGQAVEFMSAPPTVEAFRILMDFLYFGKMEVTPEQTEELLAAADFLQIVLPGDVISKQLNIFNWESKQRLCSKYNCKNVHRTIHHFVADHFRHLGHSFGYRTKGKSTKESVARKCGQLGEFTRPALSLVYLSRLHHGSECEHSLCCYDSKTKRWFEMEKFPRVLPISANRRWFAHAHNLYVSLQDEDHMYGDGSGVILEYNAKSAVWDGEIPIVPTSNSINGITATSGPDGRLYILESKCPPRTKIATVRQATSSTEIADTIWLYVFEKGAKLRQRWDRFAVTLKTNEIDGPGQLYFYDVCHCSGQIYFLYTKAKCPCIYLGSLVELKTPYGTDWSATEELVIGGPYMHVGQSIRRLLTDGKDLYVVVTSNKCILIKRHHRQNKPSKRLRASITSITFTSTSHTTKNEPRMLPWLLTESTSTTSQRAK